MTTTAAKDTTMTETITRHAPDELLAAVCRELFAIARQEDDTAATEAARTPYWTTCPSSVQAHREAARALRESAERLEAQAHG
jgi:hypothetical protein